MTHYPSELKQKIINEMAPPNPVKISELVLKYNISKYKLYSWRKEALQQGQLVTEDSSSYKWSNEAKLAVIFETSAMTQGEKGEYCRNKGIYLEQIEQWHKACLSGFTEAPISNLNQKKQLIQKDKQIKKLERELNRKEKALAEAAALMVLSKKYQTIFQEEDN